VRWKVSLIPNPPRNRRPFQAVQKPSEPPAPRSPVALGGFAGFGAFFNSHGKQGLYRDGKYLAGDQGLADIDPVAFFQDQLI